VQCKKQVPAWQVSEWEMPGLRRPMVLWHMQHHYLCKRHAASSVLISSQQARAYEPAF
jgi:hypothetical protein